MIPEEFPAARPVNRGATAGRRAARLLVPLVPTVLLVIGFALWQQSDRGDPVWAEWPRPQLAAGAAESDPVPSDPDLRLRGRTTDTVPLRAGPSSGSAAIAVLEPRHFVEIIETVAGEPVNGRELRWVRVRRGEVSGYVYWADLTWPGKAVPAASPPLQSLPTLPSVEASPAAAASPSPVAAASPRPPVIGRTTESVRLRGAPATDAAIVTPLAVGQSVEVLEVQSGAALEAGEARWVRVRTGQLTGYVYWPYVTWPGKPALP